MTLVDAGPWIAILNRNDPDHEPCATALNTLTRPLVTTWPAFTEAMYLLGAYGGWPAQELLWGVVDAHHLMIGDLAPDEHAQTAAPEGSGTVMFPWIWLTRLWMCSLAAYVASPCPPSTAASTSIGWRHFDVVPG